MKVIYHDGRHSHNFDSNLAMAIGYFDGIHRGHLGLIQHVKNYATNHNIHSAVMTFFPNPLLILGKIKNEYYLTSLLDKEKLLEDLKIDYLIIVDFSTEVSRLSPNDFFAYFIQSLPIDYIACGFDYHFGFLGQGNANDLKHLANGLFPVYIQDKIVEDDQKISSTRIRNELLNGNILKANNLLSRPYKISGKVIRGRQIGRMIGFPTANIDCGNYFIPQNGVYGVIVEIFKKKYIGMCNIGYNPTICSLDTPSIEIHIFEFHQDIYDENIDVYFYCRVRNEIKFNSVDQLVEQLESDQVNIQQFFNQHSLI